VARLSRRARDALQIALDQGDGGTLHGDVGAGAHMWTAPVSQGLGSAIGLVECSHMSGLCGAVV